ncbi:DUF6492 family protein [Rhodoferax sp. GW822-FHT02A01]|uniref:DUF6492 family protein n=1 Tax=Rhodoferax sp. GW822-FHT02A01 TaxID=3141537 RepID=UPI00315C9A77
MKQLVLYCKSYPTDLKRVVRLAHSVKQYNQERLPFYVSVQAKDAALFREHLGQLDVKLIDDEDIICASPRPELDRIEKLAGSISQQIVKSEFWRLDLCESYVCLDSDAFFIRPFSAADFVAPNGTPYTVIDEAHDILEGALLQRRSRVLTAFQGEAELVQKLFGRSGKKYSFGPFPLVWHRDVWKSLEAKYLSPRGMNFVDAITTAPIESRWYGEALLAYKAIELLPSQEFFKVYHYAWQKDRDFRSGMTLDLLSRLYCGVIYQSAWEREMDWPEEGGGSLSRLGRRLRRKFGRI